MSTAFVEYFSHEDIDLDAREELPPEDPAELAAHVSSLGMRAADLLAEMQANRDEGDRLAEPLRKRLSIIENWVADENAGKQKQFDYLTARIRALAGHYPYERNRKSRKLPWGKLGSRKAGGALTIVDMAAAVAFAREKGMPITETVGKTPIKEYVNSTGERLDFVEVEPVREEYFVEIHAI
jgi:hypothetical protein